MRHAVKFTCELNVLKCSRFVVSIFVLSTLAATVSSVMGKFTKVFSIQENVKTLFSLENSENTFLSLHALRFIFTLWMIIAHSNLYTFGAVDNLQFSFTFSGDFKIQPVFSTFIAVETFFVLGGFLVAYSFFQSRKQRKMPGISLKSTLLKIIMRFIRFNIGFSIVSRQSLLTFFTIKHLIFLSLFSSCARRLHASTDLTHRDGRRNVLERHDEISPRRRSRGDV